MNGNLKDFALAELKLPPLEEFVHASMAEYQSSREEAEQHYAKLLADEVWISDEYQVNLNRNPPHGMTGMTLWHLSIKRRSKMPIHDWRDLQAIKNVICGPQYEAVEVYPATDRTADGANQYHLWVFVGNGSGTPPRLPFGFIDRRVDSKPPANGGQRKLHNGGQNL